MKIPVEVTPAVWGFLGGALALAIVGFASGGCVSSAKAAADTAVRVDDAVVAALAPVCVEKFQRSGGVPALVELKKTSSWSQGDYIEKGGWATMPGTHSTGRTFAVANACAALLAGRETRHPH